MNQAHLELCSSAEWADMVRGEIIPWVRADFDLGDDVLEVGPGPGRTTEVLAEIVPRLSAAEVDPGLAAALSERMAPMGVEVTLADATDLPYEDGRFSAVLSFTMLHHVPTSDQQDLLFAEAARVLRPGGLFAGVDSVDSEAFRDLHVDDICNPIDPAALPARLQRAGLIDVEVHANERGFRFSARRAPAG